MHAEDAILIEDFATLARGYCAWCENTANEKTATEAATWLARLHAAALGLPACEPGDTDAPDLPVVQRELARQGLAQVRGRYYRSCFDLDPACTDPVTLGDLDDDLQDIYSDLWCALALFDAGEKQTAAWEWAFGHQAHWGRHAVSALKALYSGC
ncbi:hypothetical protein IGB42_00286 [Andreprevotia sp. IGB-42]|uniref:DUF5063 domain-containing protein n=1 Tax=Andreprevotia sp. IGB-42 TaxID=2497473 RepID=UPI00135CF45C|nr:DUF5063 domain-containing protein [Andreprevotia sp. IGB-42]KAF0815209.1 hypothetical protein IGB42_00286 [Andreprevotia sp. IGB-42]